jgi:predicted RNA-binding protein with RPS1 domain
VEGLVKALKPFGAFVGVGSMSGLLHISQISYDSIDDLEKALQTKQPTSISNVSPFPNSNSDAIIKAIIEANCWSDLGLYNRANFATFL